MVPTIPAMQAIQVLASSSVAAAAESMFWLSFAVSQCRRPLVPCLSFGGMLLCDLSMVE
jgi:hypothetical protein